MKYESEHEKEARRIIDEYVKRYNLDDHIEKEKYSNMVEDYVKENHLDKDKMTKIYKKAKENSIQDKKNSKVKVIKGETYKYKGLTMKNTKTFLAFLTCWMGVMAAGKGLGDLNTISEYKRLQKEIASEELPYDQVDSFIASQNKIDLRELEEIVKSLDKDYYDINGDRVDGTHNQYRSNDKDALFTVSDKYLDAIQNSIEGSVEEYKGRGR